ncbi:MAG: type II secretion system minor pseudopilin GspK [Granulosicoccaceae bacterium]
MRRKPQQGIAIITVMLIVALAAVVTTTMMSTQHTFIRRATSYQSLEQAQALAVAGERFSAAVLKRDFDSDGDERVDSREDDWAISIPPLPIAGGTITGCIYDLNGQFNINNLLDQEGAIDSLQLDILKALTNELALPADLASAIADWVDADDQPLSDGAEFEYYSNLESPYRAANRPMQSVTELRLVRGLNGSDADSLDAYNTLLPYVSALPRGSTININTAAPVLLEALWDKLDGLGQELHRWPVEEGWKNFPLCADPEGESDDLNLTVGEGEVDRSAYESVAQFVDANRFKDDKGDEISLPEETQGTLSVYSDYFLVRAEIQFSDTIVKQYSVLHRSDDGRTAVNSRWRSFD